MVFVGEYVKQKQLSDSLRRDGMLPVYVCEDDAVIRAAQKAPARDYSGGEGFAGAWDLFS